MAGFDNRITELEKRLSTAEKILGATAKLSMRNHKDLGWSFVISWVLLVMILLVMWVEGARAAGPWSQQDRTLEAAWVVCHLADWGTTADLSRRYDEGFYETNFILGKHPDTDEVHLYMAAWMLIHPLVTNYLPPRARPIWQYVTIGVSGAAAANNLSVGLNMKF